MSHPVFQQPFNEWLADRLSDFSQALKRGEDPEVTFSAQSKGMPKVTCQIRLIDLEGVYTREDIPIEIIRDGRK